MRYSKRPYIGHFGWASCLVLVILGGCATVARKSVDPSKPGRPPVSRAAMPATLFQSVALLSVVASGPEQRECGGVLFRFDNGQLVLDSDFRDRLASRHRMSNLAVLPTQTIVDEANRVIQCAFPADVTQFSAAKTYEIRRQVAHREGDKLVVSTVTVESYYVPVQRRFAGLAIYGPKTSAALVLNPSGSVFAARGGWAVLRVSGSVNPLPWLHPDIQAAVMNRLRGLDGSPIIKSNDLAYYVDAKGEVHVVYRVDVVVSRAERSGSLHDDHLILFVDAVRPDQLVDPNPAEADAPSTPVTCTELPKVVGPSFGRYVATASDADWADDARQFADAVRGNTQLVDSENFFSQRRLFVEDKRCFVDFVTIALVEGHGSRWSISMQDSAVLFAVDDSGGYGAPAGRLRQMILHSCKVIPSPDDVPSQTEPREWHEPWWRVFDGLRSVVGYRTEMAMNDGASAAYARKLTRSPLSVVDAWFLAAFEAPAYQNNASPFGRPAVVADCDFEDDKLSNIVTDADKNRAPTCLVITWAAN